jgi:hypothetical protein
MILLTSENCALKLRTCCPSPEIIFVDRKHAPEPNFAQAACKTIAPLSAAPIVAEQPFRIFR